METRSKNITVAVSPYTYARARVWAAERNLSLSSIVGQFLADLPNLRGLHNLTKADLPRRVRKPRKAQLYVKIEAPSAPALPHTRAGAFGGTLTTNSDLR